jgi:hypothetical protein
MFITNMMIPAKYLLSFRTFSPFKNSKDELEVLDVLGAFLDINIEEA